MALTVKHTLTPAQEKALHAAFGDVLDVEREIRRARDYAEHIHQGRPYTRFSRFVWNWLRRAEQWAEEKGSLCSRGRGPGAGGRGSGVAREGLTREELERLMEDDSPQIRMLAREKLLELETQMGQDVPVERQQ